jgi:hypothetical protein
VPTITKTKFATQVRNFSQPDDSDLDVNAVDVDFPTAAPVATDIIQLVKIPAGVKLQDYEFHFPDLDSGATFAFSFGVLNATGDDIATAYATGVIAGQSNAIVENANTACSQADASADRLLGMKITTAAAGWVGAGLTGQVLLMLRG